ERGRSGRSALVGKNYRPLGGGESDETRDAVTTCARSLGGRETCLGRAAQAKNGSFHAVLTPYETRYLHFGSASRGGCLLRLLERGKTLDRPHRHRGGRGKLHVLPQRKLA